MWCGVRLAIAPVGDAIASGLARAVPSAAPPAPNASPPESPSEPAPVAPIPDPTDAQLEAVGALPRPRGVASRSPVPQRATSEEPSPAASAAPADGAPQGTIFVPAALVSRALERRDVGARNATTPDGAQLGARLVGVSRYGTGLRDGDVVVSVAGTRTPTVSAMTTAALQAAGGVAPRISGRILRGDTTMTVVLELPR